MCDYVCRTDQVFSPRAEARGAALHPHIKLLNLRLVPELLSIQGGGAAHQEQSAGVAHAAVAGKALIVLEKLSRHISSSKHERQILMPSHAPQP